MNPKISIIVPVYNVEKYLPKCLDSLVNQTMKEIEIICVNDGSTDGSPAICDAYAAKDSRFKVLHKKNRGVSLARNEGLGVVEGVYYMFVDSDDWLDEDCCERMYNKALEYDADVVMCTYVKEFAESSVINHIIDEKDMILRGGLVKDKIHRRLFGPIEKETARPQDCDILISPCMQLFRTEKFIDIRFEDIKELGTFEDGLYQIDLYARCYSFVYYDEPFYHYRKTNEQSIVSKYKKDLYKKWENLYSQLEGRVENNFFGVDYQAALSNRIAIGIIGLGLNETSSKEFFCKKVTNIKSIISLPRYKDAFKHLDTKYMGLPWKILFFLCRHQCAFLFMIMLELIQFIRKHQ